ncbi:hypothetical protein Poli38472_007797 [Pythium oligandrum]|uniref:Uncharacterized protein n=1 Tax=Pythium oligandrum TaxID=41045 RepID=A0A8K1CRC2_PYTOL|nr:hypothetical protein Poli38472_007797 [Pythium oligandrum]|eukprot:TMW68125.1 hypothetical protein Poli38472_007797 [Pythium oligandrum]
MAKTNLNTLVLGVVKMCENEAKEGNLPVAGSGSLDTGAGSLSLNDTASVGDLPISTEEEDAKIKELGDSKEREKACGKPGDDYTNVRDSPRCSRPECLAYYKDTYLKMMPDCRDKAYMKLYIARCEAVPETAPAPSSSTTTIPSLVVTGIVALTALLGRKEKPHEMLFIASKPGCGQAQAT